MRATNGKTLSQIDRVLAAAQSYRGVCQVDFLGPETVDGGPPITRLAARIQDAEDRGYRFEIVGTRNKTRVYRLLTSPEPALRRGADPDAFLPGKGSHTPPRPVSVPSGGGQVSLFEAPAAKANGHWERG